MNEKRKIIFYSRQINKPGFYFAEKNKKPATETGFKCAEEEIRTPKPFRALPPQSSASTSFATSAWVANLMNRSIKILSI